MHRYSKPGKYVAICNKSNFDGHYIKVFDFPEKWGDENYVEADVDAAWYFLNRVDFQACIEAVYPIEIFHTIHTRNTDAQMPQLTDDEIYMSYVMENESCPKEQEGA